MVRKIIAKDIVLGNVNRSIHALDEYIKYYNKQNHTVKTETLVNELKIIGLNLNSFKFIKLEPMTINTLFKTYNYNFDKYKYLIMFPKSWSFINMCYIQKQYTSGLKLERQGIRGSLSADSQKEVIDALRSGKAFLLVADKNIDVLSWRNDSNYKDRTHIVDILKAHDRVQVVDMNLPNITVLGHNNKEVQLNSYDIIGYSRGYNTTLVDYLDKSGYSRVHFQMQLKERLKELINNKLKEKFTNGSTVQDMCDTIQNYQVAVTVLPTDTIGIIQNVRRYSDYFCSLLGRYYSIIQYVEENQWEEVKTQTNKFNSMKENLDEILRNINSLRTNVIEQQTCGI